MHKQRVVMIVLSAIGALGTFLPWVNIPIIGSINGTAGADGWITMGLFAATLVATFFVGDRARPLRIRDGLLVSAPAVLAALVGGYKIFDFYSTMNSIPGDNPFAKGLASTVSVGPGLFAIVLMGLGVPGVAVAMERGAGQQAANPVPSKPLPRSVFAVAIVAIGVALVSVVAVKVLDNPKNLKLTEGNQTEVTAKVKEAGSISGEDKALFAAAMVRSELSDNPFGSQGGAAVSWTGKTVSEVIDAQRKWAAEQKREEDRQTALATAAKAKQARVQAELGKALVLSVVKKELVPADAYGMSKNISIRCTYQNTSSKDIRAFQGTVHFNDLFGESIFKMNLKISDPIASGDKGIWDGSMHFNEFMDDQKRLAATNLSDMKVEWSPQTVIFADGTTVGESSEKEE